MHKKRGQAAMEYIAIVGVSLLIISVGAYFFFQYKDMNDEEIAQKRLEDISNDLRLFTSEAYYSTGAYKKTVDIDLPAEVSKVYVQDQFYLVFEYADGSQQVYEFDTPIFTQVDPLMTGKLVVERVGDITVICSSDPCKCDETEICDNLLDDDCDGMTDGADSDCCADADGDGFTAIDLANPLCDSNSLASDCNDNDIGINPLAFERCEAIDYDCDGQLFNDDCCDFSCYVEEEAGMDGIGTCREGFDAVLSLSSVMHAHAQDPEENPYYQYDICCNKKEDTGVEFECSVKEGQTCSEYEGKAFGFAIGAEGGSHVEGPEVMKLPDSVCCKVASTAGVVGCEMKTSCESDEVCIASISDMNGENSELGKCGTYTQQICCERASATCGSMEKQCGEWDDGFGNPVDCGTCPGCLTCAGDGSCIEDSCIFSWQTSDWGACDGGSQTRTVWCEREDNTWAEESKCTNPKPDETQTCSVCSTSETSLTWNSFENRYACIRDADSPNIMQIIWNDLDCLAYCQAQSFATCCEYRRDNGQCRPVKGTYYFESAASWQAVNGAGASSTSTTKTYSWDVGDWGTCSESCGPGIETRTVVCKDNSNSQTVADSKCSDCEKPDTETPCNLGACCVPNTINCNEYCGTVSDGCGGIVNCGGCSWVWQNDGTPGFPRSPGTLTCTPGCGGSSSCTTSQLGRVCYQNNCFAATYRCTK